MNRSGVKCILDNLRETYNILARGDVLPLHNRLIAMESVRADVERYEDLIMEAD